ncbi:MAG: hypothetical protein ACRCXB_23565 [Aeromonadaceae bacterium]
MNKPTIIPRRHSDRIESAISEAMTAHANWCRTGSARASAKALMVVLTGKEVRRVTPIEETIEAVMVKLAVSNIDAADVIRMEYGAGWQNVMKRRGTQRKMRNFLWLDSTPEQRAKAVGMELSLYTSYLSNARETIFKELTK